MLLPTSAASGSRKPHVLTSLANVATVYWRSECPRDGPRRWSLGALILQQASSTGIRFRAGGLVLRREVDVPDGITRWLPFRRSRIQRLTLESGSEAGDHVGRLRVDFGRAGCFPWQTPDVTLRTSVINH